MQETGKEDMVTMQAKEHEPEQAGGGGGGCERRCLCQSWQNLP